VQLQHLDNYDSSVHRWRTFSDSGRATTPSTRWTSMRALLPPKVDAHELERQLTEEKATSLSLREACLDLTRELSESEHERRAALASLATVSATTSATAADHASAQERLREEVMQLEQMNRDLQAVRGELLNSTSWKATRPMRAVTSLLRRSSTGE
jgi:hypothetical protein